MAKNDVAKNNKKEKKQSKNKKSFFKGVKAELKKVNWITPKQLVASTTTVIILVFICAAIVFALDLGFEALNKNGVEKLKEHVNSTSTTEQNTNSNTETNTNTESTNNEITVDEPQIETQATQPEVTPTDGAEATDTQNQE